MNKKGMYQRRKEGKKERKKESPHPAVFFISTQKLLKLRLR
jgi:hypothetical protein